MRETFSENLKKLGRPSAGEKLVAAVLLSVIVLWIVPSAIRAWSYSDPSLTPTANILAQVLPEAGPALIGLIALALLRADGKPLLAWDEELHAIDWNIIFLFGGGIALGLGLERSGFAAWLGRCGNRRGGAGPPPPPFTIFALPAPSGRSPRFPAATLAVLLTAATSAPFVALGAGVN